MDTFEINEIAVIIKGYRRPENTGAECEVVSSKYMYRGEYGYNVVVQGAKCPSPDSISGEWFARTSNLRKKKPPEEEINWVEKLELKNWNPNKQGVAV